MELKLFTRKSVETLYMLAATTKIFGKKINKMSELKNIEYAIFIAKLLIHHIAITSTNSITVFFIYTYKNLKGLEIEMFYKFFFLFVILN